MITVTLQQIKDAKPCENGWKKVLKANGGVNADLDKHFPLSSILDSNGLGDTLWVISNTKSMQEHDEIFRKFSCWCALQNIGKILKYCPNEEYQLIVNWLETNNPDLRESALSAAESVLSAARSAALSATGSTLSATGSTMSATRSVLYGARSAALSTLYAIRSVLYATGSTMSATGSTLSAAGSVLPAALSALYGARSAVGPAVESAQEEKLRELIG